MVSVIYRKNKLFIIDKSKIKADSKVDEICNSLYAEIYSEFVGASSNAKYKHLASKDMLEEINKFAYVWLKKRGLI
jgi:hypothetical protein